MSIDGGLRTIFRDHLRAGWDWQSIETGMTGRGVPDANYCSRGVEGWVECKRTSAWAVKVRPEQVGWIERRVRNGGRCFVAVRRQCHTRRRSVDELWLLPGTAIRLLRQGGLRLAQERGAICGIWVGGPDAWDWRAIGRALTVDRGRD